MIATSKIIEIFNSYSKQLESSGLLLRAFVSNKQLIGAVKTFAKGVNPDSILAVFDSTLSNNGEEGIVFTTSAIYFSVVDVPGISVKCAMLRYIDIVNATISSNKISDYSSVAQINIKNLPYEYYRITNRMIQKTAFVGMLNEILDLTKEGYEFESDRAVSITNVRNYMNNRDCYMRAVFDKLRNKETLYDIKCWITDSMGLTPLHYCIALNDTDNAYRIISKTMKIVSDVYLKNQPYGIYNYCMDTVMAGITNENAALFAELFGYTDEMRVLEKKKKRALAKEMAKEIGHSLWESLKETAENAVIEQETQRIKYVESCIDQQEERVKQAEKSGNYTGWLKEREKLDRMKQKADELLTNKGKDDVEDDDSSQYDECFEEEEYEEDVETIDNDKSNEIASDDYSSLVTSEDIEQHMRQLTYEHIDACTEKLKELEEVYHIHNSDVDPRYPIIKELMEDATKIGDRLNASANDLCLICFKFKYFYVQRSFMERYPLLKEFEVGD